MTLIVFSPSIILTGPDPSKRLNVHISVYVLTVKGLDENASVFKK